MQPLLVVVPLRFHISCSDMQKQYAISMVMQFYLTLLTVCCAGISFGGGGAVSSLLNELILVYFPVS